MKSEYDVVIRGGTLVTPGNIVKMDVAIIDEKIIAIGQGFQAHEVIDAHGLLVLPGAIDPHVHLDMPAGEFNSSDTWKTGTKAAAHGGTTTVIDFIEAVPGQSLMSAFSERRALAEEGAVIDFGLHMTIDNAHINNLEEIPNIIDTGVSSFKIYTTYDFRLEDEDILETLARVSENGALVLVHCENNAIIMRERNKLLNAGAAGPASHPLSRPRMAESEAVGRILALAEVTKALVYIVHISTSLGADALSRARARGQMAFGETCPQYLLLSDNEYNRQAFEGAKFVCSPPLRKSEDNLALWRAIMHGEIQTIGTDHCPFFYKGQKDAGKGDFTKIPGGIPGVELRLSLIYSFGVGAGNINLNRWVEVCCSNPARLFGLYPRKGTLLPGSDADIVLFDPHKKVTITRNILHENVDYSPYEGMQLCGYPVMTIRRGEVIVREGEWVGNNKGQFLRRTLPDIGN